MERTLQANPVDQLLVCRTSHLEHHSDSLDAVLVHCSGDIVIAILPALTGQGLAPGVSPGDLQAPVSPRDGGNPGRQSGDCSGDIVIAVLPALTGRGSLVGAIPNRPPI